MRWLLQNWRMLLAVVCAVGAIRVAFFHLIYEPMTNARGEHIGREFEPLRPLVAGHPRISYISDEALDADPLAPRGSDTGDMMYARAQYALAPTIIAHGDRTLPLVLANFRAAERLERVIESGAFTVVNRPAANIALLRRR